MRRAWEVTVGSNATRRAACKVFWHLLRRVSAASFFPLLLELPLSLRRSANGTCSTPPKMSEGDCAQPLAIAKRHNASARVCQSGPHSLKARCQENQRLKLALAPCTKKLRQWGNMSK